MLDDVPVYPLTRQVALLAGKLDGEQQSKGVKIPFQDLLIAATALDLGYAVITSNPRHSGWSVPGFASMFARMGMCDRFPLEP